MLSKFTHAENFSTACETWLVGLHLSDAGSQLLSMLISRSLLCEGEKEAEQRERAQDNLAAAAARCKFKILLIRLVQSITRQDVARSENLL